MADDSRVWPWPHGRTMPCSLGRETGSVR